LGSNVEATNLRDGREDIIPDPGIIQLTNMLYAGLYELVKKKTLLF
jgi:hypothetical protein